MKKMQSLKKSEKNIDKDIYEYMILLSVSQDSFF